MWGVGDVLMPGDALTNLKMSEKSGKTILGPGLQHASGKYTVTKPGVLRFKEPNCYWVDSHQKRYLPARGENVIGIVVQKAGDVFKVDMGASDHASLSYLAFEAATKRNRPDVKVGDIVYGKLLVANKDTEPEMVCIDSLARSGGMGIIRDGGFLWHGSINLVRKILSSDCILLKTFAKYLPYEVAVGMNGRIWVKGRSVQETVAIVNTLADAEFMTNDQIKVAVRQAVEAISGF